MRTAVRWICTTCTAVCFLAGCQAADKGVETRIIENHVLTVAVPEDDGTRVRQEAALLEEKTARFLAKELGVELAFIKLSAEELQTAIQEKKADVAAGFVISDERMDQNCSVSYAIKGSYLVTVKTSVEMNATESNDQMLLAVSPELSSTVRSYIYSGAMNGTEEMESVEEAVKKLLEGKAGGYVCYEKEARELLKDGRFYVKDLMGAPRESYVFVTDHDGYQLLNRINRFLTNELMN